MSMSQAIKTNQTVRIAVGFALAAGFLLAAGTLSKHGTFTNFDEGIRSWVVTIQSPSLTSLLLFATWLGSTIQLFVLGAIVVLIFAWLRQWRFLGFFLIAMLGQGVLHLGFKALFAIQRPEPLIKYSIDDSYSFPSGHAIAAASFFGFLILVLMRRFNTPVLRASILILGSALIFLIGFSRIYIGVHRPSDVLSGLIAGAIWLAALPLGSNNSVTASD